MSALHALDAAPTGPGWNQADVGDLFSTGKPRVEAAVLVGLIERGAKLTVLLTQRTDHLSQHAGQISFPGGRIEASDTGPSAAAIRETFEEVGVDGRWIEPLGFLDPLETITNFRIVPMVARLRPGFQLRPDGNEVADVFEAPLSFFLEPNHARIREVEFRGRMRTIHEFEVEGRRVWGATAAMLINLRTRLTLLA
ncbi:MAG: CoA pyrophosphatase [Pseudomonadota bacterium]|nr:CoA pyrophosphatase [Pseudomonadota bacterium]